MADQNFTNAVLDQLSAEPESSLYAVLDGASIKGLPKMLWEHKPEHVCLYRGDLEADVAACAPYLVRLQPRSALTARVVGEGWGNHWGVFAVAPGDVAFHAVRKHFRNLQLVQRHDGKQLYFRFYDPRVLGAFLPTCDSAQRELMFGPLSAYFVEASPDGALLRMSCTNGDGKWQRKVEPQQQAEK